MITPGRNRIGTTQRLKAEFYDEDGVYVDPTSIIASIETPSGTITNTTYPASPTGKTAVGKYFIDYTPAEGGRHHVRWVATFAAGNSLAMEDDFIVQVSPFIGQPFNSGDYA